MDVIQPEHLGSCIKSVTNHEETILQVDLTDNNDVKDTINLLESNIKETKKISTLLILNIYVKIYN